MRALKTALIAASVMALAAVPALAGEIGKSVELKAVKVTQAPTIDGKLNDQAWLEAAYAGSKASGFVTHTGDAIVTDQSIAYVAWDEKNLYLAFKNYRADMSKLVALSTGNGSIAFGSEDDNEIYFEADHQHAGLVQFAWNPNAAKWSSIGDTDSWQVATSKDSTAWYAEVAIPWSTLGAQPAVGKLFGFNLNGYTAANAQWMAWSPTFGMFAQPSKFGHLILADVYVKP